MRSVLAIFLICFLTNTNSSAQERSTFFSKGFFTPSDTLDHVRFNYALGGSAAIYTGVSIGLYNTWYRKFPQEGFHLFNDNGEWNNMDKYGHVYSAYFQSLLCYKGAKWVGINEDKSILTGVICGGLFQTTIEIMDAFSSEWGFSIGDVTANVVGLGAFAVQQKYWGEQRIFLKLSSYPQPYPDQFVVGSSGTSVSLGQRAQNLFGTSFAERFLKDYNAQTYWVSVNIHSFLPEGNKWPVWLNIAAGIGADNLYGGFDNTWSSAGETFSVDPNAYPRVTQFYLGTDIDLTKIKTNNQLLKGVFSIFNIFKMPSPAIELNTQGEIRFHLFR